MLGVVGPELAGPVLRFSASSVRTLASEGARSVVCGSQAQGGSGQFNLAAGEVFRSLTSVSRITAVLF
jgi:hypothetical protein